MHFDFVTWSIWIVGFGIWLLWIINTAKEIKFLIRKQKKHFDNKKEN